MSTQLISDYPLFPLPLVAFPGCRLPLQIFEPRYLDLVKSSLSSNSDFGIVTIVPQALGDERETGDDAGHVEINLIGTSVRIVDFNAQPNGLLGIVCEGQQKFSVGDVYRSENKLLMAEVEMCKPELSVVVPDEFEELVHVLTSLLAHPYVVNLGYLEQPLAYWLADAARLSFYLSYLLPFSNGQRYQLLALSEPLDRLAMVQSLLEKIDGTA